MQRSPEIAHISRFDKVRAGIGVIGMGDILVTSIMVASGHGSFGEIALNVTAAGIMLAQGLEPATRILDAYNQS